MDDEEKIRHLVRVVITELFETVGVDMTTPEGRKEFRDNMDWVQSFRTGASGARTTVIGVGVASLIGGMVWLISQGVKAAMIAGRALP